MALAAAFLAGCGGGHEATSQRAPDGPLTVYLSAPRSGVEARAGQAVAAGAREALADAHARAGGRDIRLVQLDASKPQSSGTWDPAAVEANAKRAAANPATIAYIGELDEGGSAISVPVTNNAGVLQVSPLDGLTTLTREQPGTPPGTGPVRYYPSGKRTFLRLVPTDASQAAAVVAWARARGVRRLAVVQDEEVFGRVLAQQVVVAAARAKLPITDLAEPHEDPTTFDEFSKKLAATRPDAVLYTGVGDIHAGLLVASLERAIPQARIFGSSALATAVPTPPGLPAVELLSPLLPPSAYGPRARRVLKAAPKAGARGAEALYGYEAMRVVLDAIAAAGTRAGDRVAVARAALAPRARSSVIGAYRVLPGGDVSPARFGAYEHSASGTRYLGERVAQP
ncbi:MAG: branched-chain amino acid transport system substrate-binding protein [Thermoleophilaceae bacterium]|jgi:branched-chain amino acid transport system substrate-binding protein|nr:branched-chain amino acid transport system substrate-binding protein [Thermoleophilaceae bacterium]